ncbi:MAG: VTT domain-containing protein [Syntrophobacteraceae bacterium]
MNLTELLPQVLDAGNQSALRILDDGRNCWRISDTKRSAFLIDTDSYFSAFVEAVLRAKKTIFICGWDMDSRVLLLRDDKPRPYPVRLGEFLNWVVSRKPGLRAYILIWDFNMIYTLERELWPVFKLGWQTHKRLHFRLDGNHPIWASHHQKIVVVDDAIGFVGGIDLTKCRWDTSAHLMEDSRRTDAGCPDYSPFHDVQLAVDGEAARSLGELARERWYKATGKRISSTPAESDLWPAGLKPDMENVRVGISRTRPLYKGNGEIREVEALFKDSINAARRYIYVENPYLTSSAICDSFIARLQHFDGPEIVIVLPYKSSGWFEEGTMDALRARVLQKLRAADRFGRLRIYYPQLPGYDSGKWLNVHAKVFIIDDDFVRIGSSNLSNRSMGYDTECDLSIEAEGRWEIEEAIRTFRARLLEEHLGVSRKIVEEMIVQKGLIAGIEALRGSERTLNKLDGNEVEEIFDSYVYETSLIDPEYPAQPAEVIDQFVPEEVKHSGLRPAAWGVAVLLLLLGIGGLWTWTPLRQWVNLELLLHYTSRIAESGLAPLLVIGVYTIGGVLLFPVTLLMVATAMTFTPLTALIYSLGGCLASAATLYWAGRLLGRKALDRFGGKQLNRFSLKLAQRGLLTIIMIRIFPVGPYSVMNFMAGSSHIRFSDFILGTAVGLMPGLLALTFFGERLGETLRHPKIENFLLLTGIAIFFASANILIRRWLESRKSGRGAGS